MGRKNRFAIQQKNKKGGNQAKPVAGGAGGGNKPNLSKIKKDKNVFKVTAQNKVKKAKQVKNNLKKINKNQPANQKTKQDQLNEKLKDLHEDMVVKKDKPAAPSSPAKSNKKQKKKNAKKAAASTKEVESGLNEIDVASD